MATMSRGELAAELSRCEDLLRRWVLKAWVRGTETLKHAEIVASLEARLRDRACRVDGAFDDAGSTLALRRERDEYAAALTAAAAERDAAEARADAAERGRSGGGYELDRLRDENERLKKRAPPSDVEAALADARREAKRLLDENELLRSMGGDDEAAELLRDAQAEALRLRRENAVLAKELEGAPRSGDDRDAVVAEVHALRYAGQQKGDSTSLQRECSARARPGKSIHASRPFREMIARPKISRNEWKTAEI